MTKTFDQIFDEYFARQDVIKAEYDARHARLRAAMAAKPKVEVKPVVIDGWYTAEQYAADYAAGRNTD